MNFIKASAGDTPEKVLDVACGTGGYSIELAKDGYSAVGIDLDSEMISRARLKAEESGAEAAFYVLDMREMASKLKNDYKVIFCIGNSIVHLGSSEEILKVLKQMNRMLLKGGALVLQTVNYDRIIKHSVDELPAIINDEIGLKFIRKYEYKRGKGLIDFNTALIINNENENTELESSIELLPMQSSEMKNLLQQAGFDDIKFYGDFKRNPFGDDTFAMVVEARR